MRMKLGFRCQTFPVSFCKTIAPCPKYINIQVCHTWLLIPLSKPSTSIGDPWPTPTPLPALTQKDDCGDYEAELAVVIGKTAKNVGKDEAMDHVLGYTACNDVSSRTSQFAQSQWSFSKGFDGSCPLG
jgi:2-keto-4-pentenoate hydratase/2-oxohepta-3-ene-1,7-dioic acid hydratase in catechol pathway